MYILVVAAQVLGQRVYSHRSVGAQLSKQGPASRGERARFASEKVHRALPIYSVRIDRNLRAVGMQRNGTMIWFWIGRHSAYERLLIQVKDSG